MCKVNVDPQESGVVGWVKGETLTDKPGWVWPGDEEVTDDVNPT